MSLRKIVVEDVLHVHALAHKNLLTVHRHKRLVAERIVLFELVVNHWVICCPRQLFEVRTCICYRWIVLNQFFVGADLGSISNVGSLNSDSLHLKEMLSVPLVPAVFVDVHDELLLIHQNLVNSCLDLKLIILGAVLYLLLLGSHVVATKLIRIIIKHFFRERLAEDVVVSSSSHFELSGFEKLVFLLQLLQFLFLGQDSLLIRNCLGNTWRLNWLLIVKFLLLILISNFKLIKRLDDRHVSLNIKRLFKCLVVHSLLLFNFSARFLDLYV